LGYKKKQSRTGRYLQGIVKKSLGFMRETQKPDQAGRVRQGGQFKGKEEPRGKKSKGKGKKRKRCPGQNDGGRIPHGGVGEKGRLGRL